MKNLYLELDEKFKEFVVERKEVDNMINPNDKGVMYKLYFPSVCYGASIIKHFGSYGYEDDLWELALLTKKDGEFKLCYKEIVDYDVLGFLNDKEVNEVLKCISKGKVNKYVF